MTLSEELTWRGFVKQSTYKDLRELDTKQVTFYFGVDPSADSMTIGNLAAAMMVRAFIKHGHHPILLVGGATGLIGDPDGKSEERQLKTLEEIAHNKASIAEQYRQIFGEHTFKLVDNYDWFKDMGYLEFLREIGKHVPLRQMLGRDFIQTRLGEDGSGISYAEFSYVLIQAYDFLYLNKHHDVTLQVCGSDQWGNSVAGVELIRRISGSEANVYAVPLVINQSTGKKFGKSEGGAVWLDAAKTTPDQFYQFWINADDAGVESYLKIFTELDKTVVDETMVAFEQNRSARAAQKKLAYEVTALVHGQAAADAALANAQELTAGKARTASLEVVHDASIIDALLSSELVTSKSEARQLLSAGGVYINDDRTTRDHFESSDFQNGMLRLRRGKTLQNTVIIKLK
jgi:tyrosyl-tRNA synthetase